MCKDTDGEKIMQTYENPYKPQYVNSLYNLNKESNMVNLDYFDMLPDEIIEYIVKKMPVHSLIAFSCTSTRLANICSDDKLLKEHINSLWDLEKQPLTILPTLKSWRFTLLALLCKNPERPTGPLSAYADKVYVKDNLGVISYYDSRYYEGEIKNGVPHGQGRMVSLLFTYEGSFSNGYRNGYGKHMFANGITYEGEYKDSKQTGKGIKTWPNGNRYEGQFANDKANGTGIMTWKTGQKYEGQFVNDQAHGLGTMTFETGIICQGEFVQDKVQGKALVTLPAGNKLIGDFKDGVLVMTVAYPEPTAADIAATTVGAHQTNKSSGGRKLKNETRLLTVTRV